MSIFHQQTLVLKTIYPEHVWIDVDLSHLAESLDRVELNRLCIEEVSKHLSESLGLVVKSIFPSEGCRLSFINKFVDGFSLSISGTKVNFMPSLDLDLMGFEIQREWVDLSNWIADYYVPIRVDPEHNCLHLWGFISHQCLQQQAKLERNLQSYEVTAGDLISDLDSLWIGCELVASGIATSERGKIPSLTPLSAAEANILIDRLQQHPASFSPRLVLPFDRWGAIIDDPEYLRLYANRGSGVTKITNWFRSQLTEIETASALVVERGWVTIAEICQKSTLLPGYFSTSQPLKFGARGVELNTESEISRAVNNLYANQNSTKKVDLPIAIDSPSLQLAYLMQHTTDETLRWQAAEYLWTIAPDNTKNWQRRIKDLGLVMHGHRLGIMVSAIPSIDGRYAILNRVYPIGNEDYLPPDVQLNLFSEHGDRLYQVISRSTVMDSYIQLYFTASIGDRFNIGIAMDGASITEAFAI
jgi:Protein of unknown function (DUF1822)